MGGQVCRQGGEGGEGVRSVGRVVVGERGSGL